jgi:sulfonate transport system permease protein
MKPEAPALHFAEPLSSGANAKDGGSGLRIRTLTLTMDADPAMTVPQPAARTRSGRRALPDPLGVAIPLFLAVAWEAAARAGALDRSLFSAPSDVLREIAASAADGVLWTHIGVTSLRVLAGFLAGTAAATALGTLTGASALSRRLLDPVLQSIRSIPSLAWVPLFILWLGIGEPPKITLIALGAFFPVYLSLFSGIRDVDRKLIEAGLACRKRGWKLIREVYLPATLPAYHIGLRSGMGLGWMFVVAAEIMGASRGVGYLLVDGQATGRPAVMIASLLLFALLGKLADSLLVAAGAPWLHWQDTCRRDP